MTGSNIFMTGAAVLLLGAATPVAAQTWGQPVYVPAPAVGPWSGGAYAATGRLATGYGGQGYYVVPTQGYGYNSDRGGRYGWSDRRGNGYGQAYPYPRYDSGRRAGYRDWYGYNDDRPPTRYRDTRHDRAHDRDCDCGDLYLYDR